MKKLSQKILIVSVILTLAFIWINSMLPGDLSGRESGWVQRLVEPVLDFVRSGQVRTALIRLAMELPDRLSQALIRFANIIEENVLSRDASFLVRKAAHFSEYALLGYLMGLLCVRKNGRSRFFLPEAGCLAAALIDEGIQLFSEGRAAQLRDVCIDLSGATLGLIVALILLAVLRLFFHYYPPKTRQSGEYL